MSPKRLAKIRKRNEERKKALMFKAGMIATEYHYDDVIKFDTFQPSVPCAPVQAKEKVTKMYDDCDCCSTPLTDEQKTKRYLSTRLSDASYTLLSKAEDVFHLNQDPDPKSPKELADRLAAGKFIVRDADVDKTDIYYGFIKHYIEWRDPATPANIDGYKAFELVLQTKRTATQDIIQVGTPAEGLAALQAFESTTIQ